VLQKFVKKTEPADKFEAVHFKYDKRKELTDNELAEEKLVSFKNIFNNFDQLTVNEYSPGEGIPPHVDSHSPFEDVFCSLSLGSGTVMTITSPNDESQHVYLKPRSVIFFSGEERFSYTHSIALRKLDRVQDKLIFRKRRFSLTFRKIRKSECSCPYVKQCDTHKSQQTAVTSIDEFKIKLEESKHSDVPTEIEKKHVYDVYEKIASHFSHTRYKPWPRVAEYLNKLPKGALNADVGCGNGKYLNVNNDIFSIGTDRSFNLVNICKEKSKTNQLFVADSLKLPFRSNVFDSVISIAVVHHFSNVELRLKAISELIRILSPSGTLLIYVWALEQENKKFENQDNFVAWHLQNNYENDVKVETLGPEILKEDKKNSTVYHRYYHMFIKGELEDLLKKFENVSIVESYYDHANWCCILKKEY
jgi:alkylated DNA repair protein alkB family protein 8